MLSTGEILLLSLGIKILVASLLTIAECFIKLENIKLRNGVLVLLLMLVSTVVGIIMDASYDSVFNLFFYTLGIDNIEKYAKYTVSDIKNNVVESNHKTEGGAK